MNSLAAVEVASIAQFLPSREIALFGRCSTRLLTACSTALATKHCAPARICWTGEVEQVGGGVLRFSPVSLSFAPTVIVPADANLVFERLHGPLCELDLSDVTTLSVAVCLALLTHRASQSLRSVRIDRMKEEIPRKRVLTNDPTQRRWWDVQVIDALAALPRLERLFLRSKAPGVSTAAFTGAALFPALTSLSLSDSHADESSCLGFVYRCPVLSKLEVFNSHCFFVFTEQDPSCFQRIEHLTLEWLYMASAVPDANTAEPILTAGFACLSSVRALTLRMMFDADLFLPFVHHAPVLTQLTIDCVCSPEDCYASNILPSREVLAALLTAKPELQCAVQLGHHESKERTAYANQLEAFWLQTEPSMRSRLTVLRAYADGVNPRPDLVRQA